MKTYRHKSKSMIATLCLVSIVSFNTYSARIHSESKYDILIANDSKIETSDSISNGGTNAIANSTIVCPTTVSDFDGNTYNTVIIGNQCWMKQNLRTTHYANGDTLADGTNVGSIANDFTTKYVFDYNDDPANSVFYGKLYTWAAVMNGSSGSNVVPSGVQGVCPTGWHVPSDEEWKILEGTVDSQYGYPDAEWFSTSYRGYDAGENLKSTSGWIGLNANGVDLYGFTALPAGFRTSLGGFYQKNTSAYFWTTMDYKSTQGWRRKIDSDVINRYNANRNEAYSVRCLYDSAASVPGHASVITDSVYNTNSSSTMVSCNAEYDGGTSIIDRGVCWSTSSNPDTNDVVCHNSLGTGQYLSYISGLSPNTSYYVRSYVINGLGVFYGNQIQFSTNSQTTFCPPGLVDYDGIAYNIVQIGNQCWMKENLRTSHYSNGDVLVDGTNAGSTNNDYSTKYYFDYNDDPANSVFYGKLYTWAAVMNGSSGSNTVPSGVQGVCPTGWHVPSDEEWKILEGTVDSQYGYPDTEWFGTSYRGYDAGENLKSTYGWSGINSNGVDLYGFATQPSGYRTAMGSSFQLGYEAYFWTTMDYSSNDAWRRKLASSYNTVDRYHVHRNEGYSVRCLAQAVIPDTLVINSSNNTCFGDSAGYIGVSVNYGLAPFTYIWSTGATTGELSNLPAGIYSVTVTDANNQSSIAESEITEPDELTISMSVSNYNGTEISCSGGSDGYINITVAGGTTPYLYSWSNGTTTQNVENLTPGTIDVMVMDDNGCISQLSATLTEPASIDPNPTVSNVNCNGMNNGEISVAPVGGTSPYTYLWSNSLTTQTINGLASGAYHLTITDENGCSLITSYNISEPSAIDISTTTSNYNGYQISCFGLNDGFINLAITGGTTPYLYNWSNGSNIQDISGLSAGSYQVTVSDANGCIANQFTVLSQPSQLFISGTTTNISCYGASDGSISVSISGGSSQYSYLWNDQNNSTTQSVNNLLAGSYQLTATDNNGCVIQESYLLSQPASIDLSSTIVTDVLCNGTATGSITPIIVGGTGSMSYSWSTGSNNVQISSLVAGTYSLTVTDNNNCHAQQSFSIVEPDSLVPNEVITPVVCNGSNNGAINLVPTGGSSPYSYIWNNGSSLSGINGLSAGIYVVTIVDSNACAEYFSFVVNEQSSMVLNANSTSISCWGSADGAIDLTIIGGVMPFNIIWSNGSTNEDLTNLVVGNYTVTVTSAEGCTSFLSSSVEEPNLLLISANLTSISCNGNADGVIDISVSGGTTPYYYSWNNASSTEDISSISAGNYTITITDNNSCTSSASYQVIEPDSISINAQINNVSNSGGTDGSIDAVVTGGVYPYYYSWSNGSTNSTISGLSSGIYSVSINDANGCFAVDLFTVAEPVNVNSPNWQYTITGSTHSILIQNTIPITIDGLQISNGDFIGVFFDSLGTLACAGYIQWNGVNIVITAWGEDNGNDGFVNGEAFKWIIWRQSDGLYYDATPTYMPAPTMPDQGNFSINGLSGLASLEALTIQYQYINLPEGWSYFSTYIDPFEANIDSICSPIVNQVIIVKDGTGSSFWPQYGVNMIGDLTIGAGYQIKMSSVQTLEVAGLSVQPESTPITIIQGWSYLGYLRQNPASIATMLSPVVSQVIIVKNGAGQSYWPQYGVNMVGNMNPGEGYQIKMNTQQVLTYPANSLVFTKSEIIQPRPAYLQDAINTGTNMTLGIIYKGPNLQPDSEIGVFSPTGLLVGSAIINSNFTAITLWGDDELTPDTDGLKDGESFTVRIYSPDLKAEEELELTWLEGDGSYQKDKIAVAELSVNSELDKTILYQNTPNPFRQETEFSFYIPEKTRVEFTILNMLGEVVEVLISEEMNTGKHRLKYQTKNLSPGSYYYRLETSNYTETRKMVIVM